jgi:hypothetical protein
LPHALYSSLLLCGRCYMAEDPVLLGKRHVDYCTHVDVSKKRTFNSFKLSQKFCRADTQFRLVLWYTYSSWVTLKREPANSSETLIRIYQYILNHAPEEREYQHCRENVESRDTTFPADT